MVCGLPSCRISKSDALRSVTCLPWESVTTASTWTRLTSMRITAPGLSCASAAVTKKKASSILHPMPLQNLLYAIDGQRLHRVAIAVSGGGLQQRIDDRLFRRLDHREKERRHFIIRKQLRGRALRGKADYEIAAPVRPAGARPGESED